MLYINKVIKFLEIIFNISIFLLIIISLFPGSLIGYFLYGDFSEQPDFIKNPFGNSVNHFFFYIYISFLGFCLYLRNKKFKQIVYSLFFLSVILEVMHLIIPNRSFELNDLIANILGVIVAYSAVKIYLLFKNE